jgi:hypothetical protein
VGKFFHDRELWHSNIVNEGEIEYLKKSGYNLTVRRINHNMPHSLISIFGNSINIRKE